MAVIALFGGTGKAGHRALERALAEGDEVRVLVRDPARLGIVVAPDHVVVGDVLDAAKVEDTVAEGRLEVLRLLGLMPFASN